MNKVFSWVALASWLAAGAYPAAAWDYEGHKLVNQLALTSLPTNFPAFVRSPEAAERIAFLAGEPDRWRNVRDLPLRHCNGPDHYIDLELLADYELKPEMLPVFRYDFIAQLAIYRQSHGEKFPAGAWGRNEDHTKALVGLLPWAITENYSRLKSGFSYLKTYQQHGGTTEEIANAERNIVYVMGVMGHYVGDATQPLHTTIHYNGWVGSNPETYSTNSRIHAWIDGGFFARSGLQTDPLKGELRPAEPIRINGHAAKPEEMFQAAVLFIVDQHKEVVPLYRLEKERKLSVGDKTSPEGRKFLQMQLLRAAQWLGDLWLSAWEQAPSDTFLETQLTRRQHGGSAKQ